MVGNQHITGLAIETGKAMETFFIVGLLDDEGKINRDALVADSGTTRITSAMSMPRKFGGSTDREKLGRIGGQKCRDAFDKLVHG